MVYNKHYIYIHKGKCQHLVMHCAIGDKGSIGVVWVNLLLVRPLQTSTADSPAGGGGGSAQWSHGCPSPWPSPRPWSGPQTHPHSQGHCETEGFSKCYQQYWARLDTNKHYLSLMFWGGLPLHKWQTPVTNSRYSTHMRTLWRPMTKDTLRLQGLTKLDQLVSRVMYSPLRVQKRMEEWSKGCPACCRTEQRNIEWGYKPVLYTNTQICPELLWQ